jgi:hypothetical protein
MRLVPKNAQIEIPTNNEAGRRTLTQTQILGIKNEIKSLHEKEQKLYIQYIFPITLFSNPM